MKKRILGTGVALLMATNIFANAVSAQGLDGENLLAEAKKTTEENITLSAAPVIRGTAWQMDSAEMWKFLHCAFVKQGLLWNKPVSDYANPTTCGNIDTSPLISNNSRLEAQRRLVEEFIKNQNKNSQNQSHNSTEKHFSLTDYRAFGEEIKFLNSFEKRDKTIGNWTQFLTSVNDFLKKYPNLPERTKTQLVMMGFGSNLNISHDQFKRIIAAHRLDEIQKITDKSNHLSDNEIVHLATFLLPDSKINIVRKNTTQNSAQFLNNITFNPISKDGKLLDVATFNIELRNAPNWVTLDNTNTISNSFNLKIHENNINFNENFSKEFQIILTNKKTGKVFMETISLNVLDYESTDNVLLFSIPQLTLELFKFTTSN